MARGRFGVAEPKQPQQRINDQIRKSPIRVIGAGGEQLGVMPTKEAMEEAQKAGLDLVEVAPKETPPVCRIMDYGKFKYQQKKRQSKGHSHQVKTKEVRLRPKTGEHDIMVKVNRARDFLEHKNKVSLTVQFRGRELAHEEEGRRVLEMVLEALQDVAKVEAPPKRHGRRINCMLGPK